MAPTVPRASRYTVEDTFAALQITIPAPRNWLLILFLGFWLGGWATGEVIVGALLLRGILAMLSGQTPDTGEGAGMLFMAFWLTFWTLGGGFALFTWLWNLAGKEIVTVDGESLTIRKAVLGIGRSRRYEAAYVDRLRVSEDSGRSQGPWSGGLAFDYGGATVRFGAGLTPSDAHDVLARIADRFPSLTRGQE
ncbi:MAG: hypothetical protein QHH80_04685 [Anaerolineae bacterium]|jgi:hypothetical protein|nr:hypothetical protein [Anaerolineae bacterium]